MHKFHKENAFKCDVCGKDFFSKRGLMDHHKNHISKESIEEHDDQITMQENLEYVIEETDGTGDTFLILPNLNEIERLVGVTNMYNVIFVSGSQDDGGGQIGGMSTFEFI